jgi:hypothetical protein
MKAECRVRTAISGDPVKSGKGVDDTWAKMLQQIPGVTERISAAIIAKYPSSLSLNREFIKLQTSEQGKLLIGIQVESLAGKSFRNLGPTIAKRIADVLMGRNPDQVI